MKLTGWLDRHIWAIPFIVALPLHLFHVPQIRQLLPLVTVESSARSDLYGSVAGSAGTLAGLAIAVVAILVSPASPRSASVERARMDVALLMIVVGLLFLLVAIGSTVSLIAASDALDTEILILSGGGVLGLFTGGVALTLALIEARRISSPS